MHSTRQKNKEQYPQHEAHFLTLRQSSGFRSTPGSTGWDQRHLLRSSSRRSDAITWAVALEVVGSSPLAWGNCLWGSGVAGPEIGWPVASTPTVGRLGPSPLPSSQFSDASLFACSLNRSTFWGHPVVTGFVAAAMPAILQEARCVLLRAQDRGRPICGPHHNRFLSL